MSEINQYLREKTSKNLAVGALSYTTSFNSNVQVMQVLFHFSGATSETVTVTLDSRDGSTYDTVLDTSALSSKTDYVFRPSGGCILMDGDEIIIACTAANGTNVVYATIIVEPYGRQKSGTVTNPGL